jgi:hypothetical protein
LTAIAIWCNTEIPEYPSLWAAADSLVSRNSGSPLIGDAAKLFSLPVICRSPSSDGFFSKFSSQHSYGYAFAGSTLLGQNAYLSLVPLLTNLISREPYSPSLGDVAAYVSKYLTVAYDDVKVSMGPDAMFSIVIFGWCPVRCALELYRFQPEKGKSGTYEIRCTQYENVVGKQYVYLGDCSERVSESIARALKSESIPGRPQSRSPRYVIEDCIRSSDFPTIGGDLQLATANALGLHQYMLSRPRTPGRPEAYFSYLGRELNDELTQLGAARIGLLGMV